MKNIIAYHGSSSCFDSLVIREDLVRSEATRMNEGVGIYFSLDRNVVQSYGKYIYTLEINGDCVVDFRKKAACTKYLKDLNDYFRRKYKIVINDFVDLRDVANLMHQGSLAISGVGREVYMVLDSNEGWYRRVPGDTIEKIYDELEEYDYNHQIAYLFNYNIQNIGILRKVDKNIVRIITRERVE